VRGRSVGCSVAVRAVVDSWCACYVSVSSALVCVSVCLVWLCMSARSTRRSGAAMDARSGSQQAVLHTMASLSNAKERSMVYLIATEV